MPSTNHACFSCDAHHPVSLSAQLDHGRRIYLCCRCAPDRGRLRQFVAAFQAYQAAAARAARFAPRLAAEVRVGVLRPVVPGQWPTAQGGPRRVRLLGRS